MESVRFISLDHNLSIVMKQMTRKEVDGQVLTDPGKEINFRGPYYDTADEKEADFLRKHACFGNRIFEEVIPDDVVTMKQEVPVYICGFPKCGFKAFTEDAMKEHRQEEHSKEARERKRLEAAAGDTPVVPKKKKKGKVS